MTLFYQMEALVWITLICSFYTAETLDCFDCKNVHKISECHTTVQCSPDQNCYTDATGVGSNAVFNLGCRTTQNCWAQAASTTSSPAASIIGRQVRADVISCSQCCSQDFCNRHLCSHSVDVITDQDGQCEDNSDYNCELISGAFNVCNNLHQAKTYCRKWCGLCNFTDGGWSDWTPWSSCDVTCSFGHRLRTRSCTNPKPSVGGLDCVGNTTEISQCTLDTCPVHGNWSLWTSWCACSVSCGVGLERRDRSCTLPVPGPHGHPCVGDAQEDRVCMTKACTDGHWSSWTPWGTCSATCNGGLKVKHRSCNSPTPSLLGKDCEGNNIEYAICNNVLVYFTVKHPNGTLISGRPVFTVIDANVGGGYNQHTATFTCPISGLYQFTFTLFVQKAASTYCYLSHNNAVVTYAQVTTDHDYESATASVYVRLVKGDTFTLTDCSNFDLIAKREGTVFTGALIQQT